MSASLALIDNFLGSCHVHGIDDFPFYPYYFILAILTLCPQFIDITGNRVHMLLRCLILHFVLFEIHGTDSALH